MTEFTVKAEDLETKMKKFNITKEDLETIIEEIDTVHSCYEYVIECRPVKKFKDRLKVEAEFVNGRFKTFTFKVKPFVREEQSPFELLA